MRDYLPCGTRCALRNGNDYGKKIMHTNRVKDSIYFKSKAFDKAMKRTKCQHKTAKDEELIDFQNKDQREF